MNERRLAHHRRYNHDTRAAGGWFAAHRQQVTAHLTSHPARSLAVWGAGNCNDLDLPTLLTYFEQISLLDLDLEALQWGLRQQGLAAENRIETLQADAIHWAADASRTVPKFDVVASTCLLSQVLHFAQLRQPHEASVSWEQLELLRFEHLQLLLNMTLAGGVALLINDFLSSDTCTRLLSCHEAELANLVGNEVAKQNFFTGLNPFAVDRLIRTNPKLSELVGDVQLSSPWRWQLGEAKCYAVCLHRMRRL